MKIAAALFLSAVALSTVSTTSLVYTPIAEAGNTLSEPEFRTASNSRHQRHHSDQEPKGGKPAAPQLYPDLILKPDNNAQQEYCRFVPLSGGGLKATVFVPVKNKGSIKSQPSTVRVIFKTGNPGFNVFDKTFGAINPGFAVPLSVPIPQSAWANSNVTFKVVIDPQKTLDEGIHGEINNTYHIACYGPQG